MNLNLHVELGTLTTLTSRKYRVPLRREAKIMTELLSLNVYLFPFNGWKYMYLLGIFMYMLVVCRFIIFSSLLLQVSVLSIEIVDI